MATREQEQFSTMLLTEIGESVTATIGGTPYSVSALAIPLGTDETDGAMGGTSQVSFYQFKMAISQLGDVSTTGCLGGTVVYNGSTYTIKRIVEHVPYFDTVTVEAVLDTDTERARENYRQRVTQ